MTYRRTMLPAHEACLINGWRVGDVLESSKWCRPYEIANMSDGMVRLRGAGKTSTWRRSLPADVRKVEHERQQSA